MFGDPSGRFLDDLFGGDAGLIGDIFDGVLNAGHILIGEFGKIFDTVVKNKIVQGIIAIALYVVAIIINPIAGFAALTASISKASVQGGNTFDNFFKDPIPDAIGAVAGAYLAYNFNELVATPFLGSSFIGLVTLVGYGGIINSGIGIYKAACDKDTGSYYRSDLCGAK